MNVTGEQYTGGKIDEDPYYSPTRGTGITFKDKFRSHQIHESDTEKVGIEVCGFHPNHGCPASGTVYISLDNDPDLEFDDEGRGDEIEYLVARFTPHHARVFANAVWRAAAMAESGAQ